MACFQVASEGAGLVMVCAETSYATSGGFLNMKKTVSCKYYLITLAPRCLQGVAGVDEHLVNRRL